MNLASRALILMSVVFACAPYARADQFNVFLHNLDGSPLISNNNRRNLLQVFAQDVGIEVVAGQVNVQIAVPKNARPLAEAIDTANTGVVTLIVNLPPRALNNNRAVIFLARRFDEDEFSAALPGIVGVSKAGIQELHVAVPKTLAKAMVNQCYPSYRYRRFCRCRRR